MNQPPDLQFVTTDDLEFGFFEMGEGPLALCLHGYPDTAHTWRYLLPALAEAGYRAVAPFNRGYAPSGLDPKNRYQIGAVGKDANALHAVLGGGSDSVIIGHDWGAMAANAAAGLQPDRWSRVVTLAVPPGPIAAAGYFSFDQLKRSWYMFFQLTDMADAVIGLDDYEFIRRLWQDWSPGYDCTQDVAHFIDAMQTPAHLSAALGYYRQTLVPELQHEELSTEQALAFAVAPQPTLYLHGENDGCMGTDVLAGIDDVLPPDSRWKIIGGAGHFLHVESPGVVNAEILSFLGG